MKMVQFKKQLQSKHIKPHTAATLNVISSCGIQTTSFLPRCLPPLCTRIVPPSLPLPNLTSSTLAHHSPPLSPPSIATTTK